MMKNNTSVNLNLSELIVGLYVDLNLSWSEHPFTFSKLLINDEKTLKTIQKLAIDYVTVFPSKSKVAIPSKKSIIDEHIEAVKAEAVSNIAENNIDTNKSKAQKTRAEIKKSYEKTAQQIGQMCNDLKDRPANAIRNINDLATKLSSIFEGSTTMITQMVNLVDGDHTDLHHITNVTMLSLMVGKAEGMNASELTLLSTAALLHDVGKIKVPPAIRNKKSALTEVESKILQQHTYFGRKFIQQVNHMHPEILNTIEQHHEYLDGSGFPKGLKADQLSKMVRIVTMTNLYDNLCNAPHNKADMTPKVALATLYKTYEGKLDKQLVERLIALLGVYPPGTVVKLSNDIIGLVISVDSSSYMTPNILVYDPSVPKENAIIICLTDYPGITIKEALNLNQVPSGIHQYLGLKEKLGYLMDSSKK